jgi:hypothetical protein
VAYDHNMINNYDHLQDTASPSHMGSKNSMPHLAGGDAGYSVSMGGKGGKAPEHDPGGATPSRIGSGGNKNLGM